MLMFFFFFFFLKFRKLIGRSYSYYDVYFYSPVITQSLSHRTFIHGLIYQLFNNFLAKIALSLSTNAGCLNFIFSFEKNIWFWHRPNKPKIWIKPMYYM